MFFMIPWLLVMLFAEKCFFFLLLKHMKHEMQRSFKHGDDCVLKNISVE